MCKSVVITKSLKERFCKDMNLPIKIFDSPYFEDRLNLFNPFTGCISAYNDFISLVSFFGDEQGYFEAYNKLKDDVITYLNSNEKMLYFAQKEDMNKFSCTNKDFPSRDIYKETFDGKLFCSIDMKKGNFTALHYYDPDIVGGKHTYEDFIGMFTDKTHFKRSKYIRQVIFGNANPKRQVTLEKYMMDMLLTQLLESGFSKEEIVFFSADEIVICLDKYTEDKSTMDDRLESVYNTITGIVESAKDRNINVRAEFFELKKIPGTSGYIKKLRYTDSDSINVEFKCLDFLEYPFVLRAYLRQIPKEEDFVFIYEGHKVRLLDKIDVEVV